MRSTSNGNATGSSTDRRRRKQWLLNTFGDGETAKCELRCHPDCLEVVDFGTLWVDRWPIAGVHGGSYRQENIRPSCPVCNMSDGGRLGAKRRKNGGTRVRSTRKPIPTRDCLGRKSGHGMASVRVRIRRQGTTLAGCGYPGGPKDLGAAYRDRCRTTGQGGPARGRLGILTRCQIPG